jgi:hypothetical protein
MLQYGYIPLGLYRMGKNLRYVQTNPAYDTPLEETDAVYLLVPDNMTMKSTKPEKIHVRKNTQFIPPDFLGIANSAFELKVFS